MPRSYPVTIGNVDQLTRTPPPAGLTARPYSVARVNRPTVTGFGELGAGGYIAGEPRSSGPGAPAADGAAPDVGCEDCA